MVNAKKIPNYLTVLRLLLIPFFMFFLACSTPGWRLVAAGVFIGASLTDWLDGYLARKLDAQSAFGALFDPLADKILVMAALVMLVAVEESPRLPAWIVVVLLGREFLITGLRGVAATRGIVVSANVLAKHKTAWTMIAIALLIVHYPYDIFGFSIDFFFWGMMAMYLALILTVVTGVQYLKQLRHLF